MRNVRHHSHCAGSDDHARASTASADVPPRHHSWRGPTQVTSARRWHRVSTELPKTSTVCVSGGVCCEWDDVEEGPQRTPAEDDRHRRGRWRRTIRRLGGGLSEYPARAVSGG